MRNNSIIYLVVIVTILTLFGCDKKMEARKVLLPIPDKLVVLTFDDGVTSQYQAAQLVKKYGFGATFFVCNVDLNLPTPKMTWQQIKELYDDGFEIGNHSFVHPDLTKLSEEQLNKELENLENICMENGIPKPVTLAYPGYHTSDTVVKVLQQRGYLFARAGLCIPYDPQTHHRLLIPTTGNWGVPAGYKLSDGGHSMEYFISTVTPAKDGKISVLTFHGIPEMDDPDNSMFKKFLDYLKDNNYKVIAFKDLAKYIQVD